MNNETKDYLIKLVAAMALWEESNGHDFMADRFKKVLPTLITYGEEGGTVMEKPEDMANYICQEYQDHIGEEYMESYMKDKYPELGEVTKVK